MFAKVMKPFEYSADGINSRMVHIGEVLNFSDDCASGLVAAGLIVALVLGERSMAPSYAETPYTELPQVPAQPELNQVELAPMPAGEKIAAGLNDAIAIASGEVEPAHLHVCAEPSSLSIRDLGKGWFAIFDGDQKMTKSVRSKSEAEAELAKMLKSNS